MHTHNIEIVCSCILLYAAPCYTLAGPCFPGAAVHFSTNLHGWPLSSTYAPLRRSEHWVGRVLEAFASP